IQHISIVSYSHHTPSTWHLFLFFFNATATTVLYTLSLHDALPISEGASARALYATGLAGKARHDVARDHRRRPGPDPRHAGDDRDRKSTRLNSSHVAISYAVFCLKKKKIKRKQNKREEIVNEKKR